MTSLFSVLLCWLFGHRWMLVWDGYPASPHWRQFPGRCLRCGKLPLA